MFGPEHRWRKAGLPLLACLCLLVGPLLRGAALAQTMPNAPNVSPPDPSSDIPWSGGKSGMADVQNAFNHARATENAQRGMHLPNLALPPEVQWSAMSDGQRALWLINRERADRGLLPMYGLDPDVSSVAQAYAQFLLANNKPLAHDADGRNPGQRLSSNPKIAACLSGWAENLYASMTTANSIPLPLEQAVYEWMYDDGSCCGWGHRHNILANIFTNGPAQARGLLGIGRAAGPYQGWNRGEIVVMDAVDPCPAWSYPPAPQLTRRAFIPAVRR